MNLNLKKLSINVNKNGNKIFVKIYKEIITPDLMNKIKKNEEMKKKHDQKTK